MAVKETNQRSSQCSSHRVTPVFELRIEIAELNILPLIENLPGLQSHVHLATDKQKFYISTTAQPFC